MDRWRSRKIAGEHPYVFLDGVWLKRIWGGGSVLVAIGVAADGFREVLGVAEGAKEDAASWREFLRHLKKRGLKGVRLFIPDKCLGLVEALGEFCPEALWQRCVVPFYRNVFRAVPRGKVRQVAATLKAIHAQEDRRSIRTNNPMERIVREVRRRTRVVGSFPDGRSALMLVAARSRHVAGTRWGRRRYLNMERLGELDGEEVAVA